LSQREEDEEASGERRSRRHRRPRQPDAEPRAERGETLSEPAIAGDLAPDDAGEAPPFANDAGETPDLERAPSHEANEFEFVYAVREECRPPAPVEPTTPTPA
jgi:hypothetical protein